MLGTMPDIELAKKLKRTVRSIEHKRSAFGLANPGSPARRWTVEEEKLVAELSLEEAARLLGRTKVAIVLKKRQLGRSSQASAPADTE